MAQNFNNISKLEAFQIPRNVYNAIQKASTATGVNFSYMVEKAAVESSFDTNAKAKTSSATGLYQFIESTWLSMVNKHGDKYGLSEYADKISDNGKVASAADRREILALRKDPEIASYMAAELASGNQRYLQDHVGGDIGSTEMYMAHFLGAGGASGFLNAMKKSPNMMGADLFPKEARSNRGVFYDQKTGTPRSLKEIYAFFDKKFDSTASKTNFAANQPQDSALRVAQQATAPQAAVNKIVSDEDNAFSRLATLMGFSNAQAENTLAAMSPRNFGASPLRINDAQNQNTWQIFPPSLYNRLSLSQAQMMMLSDFDA